ncbi:MAG: hypothetical protein IPH20_11785 [Bacteroidales bacterium]|nr:hypothetical protein [Bacteroidales bacterium]
MPWITCDVKHSPLASAEPAGEREKTEVISDICPAEMGIEQYWWQDLAANTSDVVQKKHWLVP